MMRCAYSPLRFVGACNGHLELQFAEHVFSCSLSSRPGQSLLKLFSTCLRLSALRLPGFAHLRLD